MAMGRPPKPVEQHRLTGRANGTKKANGNPLPAPRDVIALPMAEGVPPYPDGLDAKGQDLWRRTWTSGALWISPVTEYETVAELCRVYGNLLKAHARYGATTEPADGRIVATLTKEFRTHLIELGLTPAARARLGVAEVKRVSELDRIMQRRESS